ncbi:MAG: M20/M25/M40 family metallo-hydrolase [Gammaproteobacteria bacterium]
MVKKHIKFAIVAEILFVILIGVANNANADNLSIPTNNDYKIVDDLFNKEFIDRTSELVKIKTYVGLTGGSKETRVNIQKVRDRFKQWADDVNKELKTAKLEFFEWENEKNFWLFGFRLGSGKHKVAIITHLDTVPPGQESETWHPFEPKIEQRIYLEEKTDFLVGRGTLDDKGPAVVSFAALEALAKKFDNTDKLKDFSMEVLFDTSEETDMAMPHFFADPKNKVELGIVYDAMWCVADEKGIERPAFSVSISPDQADKNGLWIESFNTASGPSNQIADFAAAIIKAGSKQEAKQFAAQVKQLYEQYTFDDPDYRKADIEVQLETDTITLKTRVKGAQHGSAPQENREKGANPLVSLSMFLSHLIDSKQLNNNSIGQMARFMTWTWGTHVFGEDHPGELQRADDIFKKGNGTTYALTKIVSNKQDKKITLEIDIRYALGHHGSKWDGKTWGTLKGDSQFQTIFSNLVSQFNKKYPGPPISVVTKTMAGPDLKNPDGSQFSKVAQAFKEVTGKQCPVLAIGGGTDAKGYPELIAAGSLFTESLGPPVNFHGIDEGAPIEDLRKGARILYRIFLNEVEASK